MPAEVQFSEGGFDEAFDEKMSPRKKSHAAPPYYDRDAAARAWADSEKSFIKKGRRG